MDQGPMTKGERTRTEIIEAAHNLFLESGYHGTSMRQIATNAGIALGGIYNHFDSKEEIFAAVLDTYHPYHEILPILQNAQGETIEEFVKDALDSMISALDRRPDILNLMFIEIVEFDQKHLPDMFKHFFPGIMSLVENLPETEGKLRSIPLPIIVRTFIGMTIAYYLTERIFQSYMPLRFGEDAREYLIDIFLYGIIAG
jgi:AcrR family transcriptional regulator